MLKNKTITTDKATLLVVEMPEGVNEYHHSRAGVSLSQGDGSYLFISGKWQLLGRLPDITEDQWSEVVEDASYKYPYEFKRKYENYNEGDFDFNCSSESALSLLQANEVYFENPLGKEPDSGNDFYRDALGITSNYWSDLLEWQEAQSKVWDKERAYLFKKI